ncbi:MAG: hypothetical protein LBQ63_00505 [Deltaproteobacteria bacterium]|jgi:pilus assembly protein TadC|nr:hypothetical protein [Deltaproteobacteria bacterium]
MKLNIFQRGILQKVAVAAVYFSCFLAGGFFIDWLEKRRFATAVAEARKQGVINSEDFDRLKPLIAWMDETAAFALIVVILIRALASRFLMRRAANLNRAWPVTLSKAVEFRYAMNRTW